VFVQRDETKIITNLYEVILRKRIIHAMVETPNYKRKRQPTQRHSFEIEFRKSHTRKGDTMHKLHSVTKCSYSTKHPLIPSLVSLCNSFQFGATRAEQQ
jgi:hypothetical protein